MERLHIRDLFWLILVVAVALGWLADHRKLEPGYRRHVQLEQHLHAIVEALANEGSAVGIGKNGKAHLAHGAVIRVEGDNADKPLALSR